MVDDLITQVEISDAEMKSIQEAILKRYGIDFFNYEPKSFKRRLARVYRRFGFSTVLDFWSRTLKDKDFIQEFINEVSVGLTSLFRDPKFWIRMKELVEKELNYKDAIKVWHAGCSTGEEVFTFGVLLSDLALLNKCESIATDISSTSLASAQTGSIGRAKFAEYKKNYLGYKAHGNFEDLLIETETDARIAPRYFQHVKFRNSNLIMDEIEKTEAFDIVFCRNVLIYFDQIAKLKVIEKIYQALKPGGFFVVGFFDSVTSLLDNEKFECYDLENRIFKKI